MVLCYLPASLASWFGVPFLPSGASFSKELPLKIFFGFGMLSPPFIIEC
jgi:hypothetical protein